MRSYVRVIFRVDASLVMGHGHVRRCLSLAEELKQRGAEVAFVCRDHIGHLGDLIRQSGYQLYFLTASEQPLLIRESDLPLASWLGVSWEQDAQETISAIEGHFVDCLVVDHYAIDYRWHKRLRQRVNKIFVIDDLADRRLDCDFLLDQTYRREAEAYLPWVSKNCRLFLGSQYALLRSEFALNRYKAIEKRKHASSVKRILISVGGVDAENITSAVLQELAKISWQHPPIIDVVLNRKSPSYKLVLEQIRHMRFKVNLLSYVDNMAELMLQADLSIGAGGTTSWERCSLGLPSVVLKTAENQASVVKNLENANVIIAGIDKSDIDGNLSDIVSQIVNQPSRLMHLSLTSMHVADGLGARRLAAYVKPFNDNQYFDIRDAYITDAELMYEWQSDPLTRKYSHNTEMPVFTEHKKWLAMKLSDVRCSIYMIEFKGQAAGVVRLDQVSVSGCGIPCLLISIYLSPSHYQRGLGNLALKWVSYVYRNCDIKAEIHSENIASLKLFSKAGFISNDIPGCYMKHATAME